MATVCKRVLYSGQVQGVGFRMTTQALAAGYAVAGYVRNLSSGEVELIAEGEDRIVEAFLAEVARHMAAYIQGTTVQDAPAGGQRGFRIRH